MARSSTTATKVEGRPFRPTEPVRTKGGEGSESSPVEVYFRPVRALELAPGQQVEETWAPKREHEADAGFDLKCSRHTAIQGGTKAQIPTNLILDLPKNYFGQVVPRSSTFFRKGLLVHTGTLDAGFRGEVMILVWNPGQRVVDVNEGDRVAQLLILPRLEVEFTRVPILSDGDRGEAGFGSTGE